MAVSYKKLWKLLIDKDIKKKDLIAKAKISPATITKMGKNGHVTTEAEVRVTWLQAKEHQGSPAAAKAQQRQGRL